MLISARPGLSFPILLILLSLVAVIQVDAYPANTHQEHHPSNQLLANGKTCQTSAQCTSQYCRRGKCDVKKTNGHQCYKDNGCVSAYCHRGICDVKKPDGHVCYKNAECLSGQCSHSKCRTIVSPQGLSTKTRPAPTTTKTTTSATHTTLSSSIKPSSTALTSTGRATATRSAIVTVIPAQTPRVTAKPASAAVPTGASTSRVPSSTSSIDRPSSTATPSPSSTATSATSTPAEMSTTVAKGVPINTITSVTGDADPPTPTSTATTISATTPTDKPVLSTTDTSTSPTATTPTEAPAPMTSTSSTTELTTSTDKTSSTTTTTASPAEETSIRGIVSYFSEVTDVNAPNVPVPGGGFFSDPGDPNPFLQSGQAQGWTLSPEGQLTSSSNRVLKSLNGFATFDTTRGVPYVCTRQDVVSASYAGPSGTQLSCTANDGGIVRSTFYVCVDKIVADPQLCPASIGGGYDTTGSQEKIVQLVISPD